MLLKTDLLVESTLLWKGRWKPEGGGFFPFEQADPCKNVCRQSSPQEYGGLEAQSILFLIRAEFVELSKYYPPPSSPPPTIWLQVRDCCLIVQKIYNFFAMEQMAKMLES